MLVRFTVENFLSFNSSEEYSPITGKVRKHPTHVKNIDKKLHLLKSSIIFGANASGKTNLVKAIGFARQVIVHELPAVLSQTPINQTYCRVHPENREKKSTFAFEITIGKKVYSYSFDILLSKSRIIKEELHLIKPSDENVLLYSRNPYAKEYVMRGPFTKKAIDSLNRYAEDLKSNTSTLFITEMNRNKNDLYLRNPSLRPIKDVFEWFKNNLVVNYPDEMITPSNLIDNTKIGEINTIIASMGLGINKIKIEKSSLSEITTRIPVSVFNEIYAKMQMMARTETLDAGNKKSFFIRGNNVLYILHPNSDDADENITVEKLCFYQGKKQILFEIYEESEGTRRILDLIEILIAAQFCEEKTFVIDDISRYLHPQLTYKFLETFLKMGETGNTQLIVTTHESHLMDLNMMRRDEIWFVEKNIFGDSHVYSMDEYNERFDTVVRKAYLEGRYGGVPIFDVYYPMNNEE